MFIDTLHICMVICVTLLVLIEIMVASLSSDISRYHGTMLDNDILFCNIAY